MKQEVRDALITLQEFCKVNESTLICYIADETSMNFASSADIIEVDVSAMESGSLPDIINGGKQLTRLGAEIAVYGLNIADTLYRAMEKQASAEPEKKEDKEKPEVASEE